MVVKMAPYQRAAVASERVVLHTRYSYCILVPGVGCGDSASDAFGGTIWPSTRALFFSVHVVHAYLCA